ncbi:uncharacterized protein LOC132744793 [Ruditapes philippinarum]|uniref:uncharacterized protein LOC132744793 n=1 Tax=Ruditapes philippinarum TaxID=129788 RepID=UPI00295A5902|nr:uncharacterized protein LOC132744793 [Ruditapes philippinarum]
MTIKNVHLVLFGYIILFNTHLAAADAATNGDTLTRVLSELEELKANVSTCEERLMVVEDHKNDNTLKASTNEQRLAHMEEMLLAAERKIRITENIYERKLAQTEGKLRGAETKLNVVEELHDRLAHIEQLIVSFSSKDGDIESVKEAANSLRIQLPQNPMRENISNAKIFGIHEEKHGDETDNKTNTQRDDFNNIAETRRSSSRKIDRGSNFPYSKRLLGVVVNHRPAFSAFLSDHVSGLGKEQTIPFDDVLLNEGNAYDPVLHAFICPVNGIYMFQSAVMCNHNQYMQTERMAQH